MLIEESESKKSEEISKILKRIEAILLDKSLDQFTNNAEQSSESAVNRFALVLVSVLLIFGGVITTIQDKNVQSFLSIILLIFSIAIILIAGKDVKDFSKWKKEVWIKREEGRKLLENELNKE